MLRQSGCPRVLHAALALALIASVAACGIKGPLRPAPKNVPPIAMPPPIANPATPPATTSPALPPPSTPP
ncbi:MAG TPA: lipoprotein [Casimicrobiaceae bacterium]|nr:lipoprotein [Casimicrobiaceae bacterium]